jgi:nicotinate-nucleotide adenylyltransferase
VRIGVFGGTFDPIHLGHLIVADEARETLCLDEVLFIPAGQPWLKATTPVSAACHRMAMVELAVRSDPRFRADDIEVNRPGATYTVDTLTELQLKAGEVAELYLILGLDSLKELARWHEPARLFDLCTVVGMSRPGVSDFDVEALNSISPDASKRVVLVEGPLVSISGTDLRRRVSEGLSIRHRVPKAVEEYIREHGLYL